MEVKNLFLCFEWLYLFTRILQVECAVIHQQSAVNLCVWLCEGNKKNKLHRRRGRDGEKDFVKDEAESALLNLQQHHALG